MPVAGLGGAVGAPRAGRDVAPAAAGEVPPVAGPVAAAPVGGGTFFKSSVFIFCFNSFAFGTPVQPLSILSCVTFAFTLGGAIGFAGFCSLAGAATMSLSPCTFVKAPDFAAADRSAFSCRSRLRR